MNSLSAAMLLNVWEGGRDQDSVRRAIALVTAACPDLSPAGVAQLPVGERDSLLLRLRERIFGSELEGLADCPKCGERVEMSFQMEQIRTESPTEPEFQLTAGDCVLRARVPNSEDLAAAATRRELLMRCILTPPADAAISDEVLSTLETRMAQADPGANIQLELQCPACGNVWLALFDIVSFFWREIDTWAQRILREVHALASAYGWSEAEILSLSSWRRQFYLEMVSP
jgi:hypothetical protein